MYKTRYKSPGQGLEGARQSPLASIAATVRENLDAATKT
jgi:hypothetical protein